MRMAISFSLRGTEELNRTAAAQNPLYGVMRDRSLQPEKLGGDSHQ